MVGLLAAGQERGEIGQLRRVELAEDQHIHARHA